MSMPRTFSSLDPASGEVVWKGSCATPRDVNAAIARARAAFQVWSLTPIAERMVVLRAFARIIGERRAQLADAISREVGKPRWEAQTEVSSMVGKVETSIAAFERRCADFSGGPAVTRFRPHGVVGVLGPFNFPGHLPNGHIVPALLAGNTVVFKPSEHAPFVAELAARAWSEAGLPAGALEIVQGAKETGVALVESAGLNALFFTGSARTGLWLAERFARTPEKILALEMGGNNPLVVWRPVDVRAAAWLTLQSAYLTSGQRCTCARRLIIPNDSDGARFLEELKSQIARIRVGAYSESPEPFMGPVISEGAAADLLESQRTLIAQGAQSLTAMRRLRAGKSFLSPGLIDVTDVCPRGDNELFGPLLKVIRVADFGAALTEANATRYGLAAGLIGGDREQYAHFQAHVRAGVINWNQPLTGASGAAPFGGIGRSGNHRPSGFFAADYCSYPVASIEVPELKLPETFPPGLNS